ncbi:hypothetical protein [Algibacter sp.]|uniref:hypothetical protein n=1 Tax=Algibacter sp. TaxID=1872428 RepID=UPI003C71989C
MRYLLYKLCFILVIMSCQGQTKKNKTTQIVGGPCEGCEAIFEFGNKVITSIDTLPNFHINEYKMKITGIVFNKDGKTPAENVIIYIYHTNRESIYETKGNEIGWA